jgi:predicted O-methyltransferase YrrM
MIRPKRILELGTYTGYSALCLAEGLRDEQSRLITIEHNDELEDTILHNLALSDLSSKITLIIGDAAQVLSCGNELIAEQPFDLVFIDADKRQYERYYDLVFDMVRPGGFILADNTLWDGHVVDPAYDKDKQTMALRRFNDKIAADERVETFILPLRDGLTFIRKL